MKKEIPSIQSAKAVDDYKLFVLFEDGVSGTIDLKPWKGNGVFEYWNNEKNFKKLRITEDKKVEWNENIDMDPDSFYLKLIGKTFFELKISLPAGRTF